MGGEYVTDTNGYRRIQDDDEGKRAVVHDEWQVFQHLESDRLISFLVTRHKLGQKFERRRSRVKVEADVACRADFESEFDAVVFISSWSNFLQSHAE